MDGWGMGEVLGTGVCAVLRGSRGCPGPDRRPGGWVRWKAEVAWWSGVLEATWEIKDHPQPLGTGSKHGVGHPTFQHLGIRGTVGHPHWSPHPAPPEGGLPQCQEAVGCREAGLGRGACSGVKWRSVAVLGSTRPLLPWGLFALREERQQRASASFGQGQAAEGCCHGYGVLHGEAPGAF